MARLDQDRLEREIEHTRLMTLEHERKAEQSRADEARLRQQLTELKAKAAATAAFRSGGGSLLLGDGITDDTLLHIAGFLASARDLLCLKLTNTRFAAKIIAAPGAGIARGDEAAAAPEMLCIADEAGRLWVAGCSDQERGWVPRRELESLLGLMREVALLRVPLLFGRSNSDITLSEGGAVATISVGGGRSYRAAASKLVMRSGRHFAQLTVLEGDDMLFGVIRPGWDVEGGQNAFDEDGHSCFYDTDEGIRYPGSHGWEGMQTAREQGDRIGMLLDLDQGSMTVWKNDEKLRVMQAEGLSGPLCWAAEMMHLGLYGHGDSARIESAPAPASPTEEELVVAKSWQRRDGLGLPQTATDAECEELATAQED